MKRENQKGARKSAMTTEEKRKLQEQVLANKKALEERRQRDLEHKSRIFREAPGKILKIVCVLSIVFSASYLIDSWLPVSYKSYKIVGAKEERQNVVTQDGWMVPATYYHVYLNGDQTLEVFMYKGEYFKGQKNRTVELGVSPIFKVPLFFKVGENEDATVKPLERDYLSLRVIPVILIVFSLLWLLIKPHYNSQTITFGYINMCLVPLLLLFMIVKILGFYSETGNYVMDVSSLILPK